MKGCFLLQRSFAPVGHSMAIVFNRKYGVENFCALTNVRENFKFLTEQTDVTYTNILLDEDINLEYKNEKLDLPYLHSLEKNYGLPNLWPYLAIDRILMHSQFLRLYPYDQPLLSHENLLKVLQITAKKIITFLDNEKPDFIFFPAVGSLAPFLLYEIAKKKNIPVYLGEYSRFKNHYAVVENPRGYSILNERFIKIKNKEILPSQETTAYAKKLIESFQNQPIVYDETATPQKQPINRQKQMEFLIPINLYKSIYWFFQTIIDYYSENKKNDYSQINPWHYAIDRIKKKIRVLIGYDDLYSNIDEREDFVYFSLSQEPELSLLFHAPFATDQIHTIKQLAMALPVHFKLYIKEHPTMVGDRTRRFYKEIKKIPNVKIINPKINSYEVIKKAKLVASINGTAGWEAILFKKPCISFGEAFYNCLSMTKYCKSFHNLAALVKEQLENFNYNEQELLDFVIAWQYDSVPVDMIHLWERRNEQVDIKKMAQAVEPLVDLLAKKLNMLAKSISKHV